MFLKAGRAIQTEDRGQDLAEYCLLTALVALIAVGIFVYFSGGVQAVWGNANTALVAGNAAVSGGSPGSDGGASTSPAH